MPVATDLAELLRQERGFRREPVELRRRDRNAMRTKRQDDARNAREVVPHRLLVRAEHLPQIGLQGLSRSRHGARRRGRNRKPASKAPQPVLGAAGLGAPTGPSVAAGLGALAKEPAPAVPKDADGLGRGESPLRARLAALEMELEALKRGSDGGASVADGGQAADLAAALKEQTEALKEALSARGGQSSITTVKTDLVWPTLTDDKSDTKDVVLFYEEFEDVCALANNCRGMSAREKLLALRARCKGSRAKTYTNAYRAAWKTGEVTEDPEAVYLRVKNKHLMFGESREEREVRIDGEHQALVKGRLSGHQFEPLFEASVADLESVGLGKTPRELYLSYLRKMPPHLQKEIRQDKRIWPGDAKDVGLRSPATWEECHKVVLEYEQREAAHRAVAHSTYSTTAGEVSDPSAALAKAQKEIRELKAAAKAAAARPSGAAAKDSTLVAGSGAKGGGKGAASKICFPLPGPRKLSEGRLLSLLPRQGAAQAGVGCQARGEHLGR